MLEVTPEAPTDLGFQLANTWPKITAHDVYAMVRKWMKCKNPGFSLLAATVEKANTYVFAGRLIRNAEVRGSTPLCSTNRINHLGQGAHPAVFVFSGFWRQVDVADRKPAFPKPLAFVHACRVSTSWSS